MIVAAVWIGAAAGAAAACALALFVAVCLCARLPRRAQPADCLVVLGARVWPDGRMSETLRLRCAAALEAWRAGQAKAIVVCGGRGRDEPVAEAEAMRAFLLDNGVPPAAIAVDADSASTRENLANARRIMAARGWSRAAIVTSDYHLQRALWLARDLGMCASGVAAPSPRRRASRLTNRAREAVSWALYAVRRARRCAG